MAQVALQNQRALELLTADKGGTCLFLNEECCYYINESSVVETNISALTKICDSLGGQHHPVIKPSQWWFSPLTTWLLRILSPIILFRLLGLITPCVLCFIQERIREVSRVTVNQLLLDPYTCLSTYKGPYDVAPLPAGGSQI